MKTKERRFSIYDRVLKHHEWYDLAKACYKITGIYPESTKELKKAMQMHDQRLLLKSI